MLVDVHIIKMINTERENNKSMEITASDILKESLSDEELNNYISLIGSEEFRIAIDRIVPNTIITNRNRLELILLLIKYIEEGYQEGLSAGRNERRVELNQLYLLLAFSIITIILMLILKVMGWIGW